MTSANAAAVLTSDRTTAERIQSALDGLLEAEIEAVLHRVDEYRVGAPEPWEGDLLVRVVVAARDCIAEDREVGTHEPSRGGRSPFFAIDVDLEDHPKFHALIRRRKWSNERGLAFLYRFLRTVRRHAANGDVTGWDDSYLGMQTKVSRPSGLIAELVAVGFLDQTGERLIVHHWHERNGKWLPSNLKQEQRRLGGIRRARAANRNELGRFGPGGSAGDSPGDDPS